MIKFNVHIYIFIFLGRGSKSSGREGGHRTRQSLISICFHNILNSFSYLSFSKILSLIDFTFPSFCPGTSLGKGNSFESQLLTGMFYHCLSRQMCAYYYLADKKIFILFYNFMLSALI